ncbi:type II toxin-antitoxin system Phd/YefM family antitoxin [Desulfurivibrio sp. D14AmB]|uniref:type II toxin-antitoxin system Phd/YefM family antitoxin n=1 Tax=Desulfurivibrio sp. D14AmB TaxID=3374370 RepID=UPI00376EA315
MKTLSVSAARSILPSLLDDVAIRHETIVISRKGKPVARLTPIPPDESRDESAQFPLRKVGISIADDFDEPDPGQWEALE